MDMHTYSGYYVRLINPENEENEEIRERLSRINRWEIKTAYPFLLNVYHDYCTNKLSATDFARILEIIESFVLRRFFCRVPTNMLNKLFISLYQSIDKPNFVDSLTQQLLKRDWPTEL